MIIFIALSLDQIIANFTEYFVRNLRNVIKRREEKKNTFVYIYFPPNNRSSLVHLPRFLFFIYSSQGDNLDSRFAKIPGEPMLSLISCSFLINKSSRLDSIEIYIPKERVPLSIARVLAFKLYFHTAPRFELHASRRDTHTLTPVRFPSTRCSRARSCFRGWRLTHDVSYLWIIEATNPWNRCPELKENS